MRQEGWEEEHHCYIDSWKVQPLPLPLSTPLLLHHLGRYLDLLPGRRIASVSRVRFG